MDPESRAVTTLYDATVIKDITLVDLAERAAVVLAQVRRAAYGG
jgi:hypothetical protein